MSVSFRHVSQDQAVNLRRLVRQARTTDPRADEPNPPGRLVAIAGAKGGVGVSSLTMRVAEALAHHGRPVAAVDANLRQADLAQIAGVSAESRPALPDVLAGRRRAEEALTECAPNLSLLPGAWAPASQLEVSAESVERLLSELDALAHSGRVVVVDAGAGLTPWSDPIWRRASHTALVTTPDRLSVLNAYATLKLARAEGVATRVGLLVNRVADEPAARRVHQRVDETCGRFLGCSAEWLGWAPEDPEAAVVDGAERIAAALTAPEPLSLG